MGLQASLAANVGGGSRGDTDALGRARYGADSSYKLVRFGAYYARALAGDWQVRARLDGQYANDPLVAPEAFGIGGANSVRGFLERERADDQGHSGSLEAYTPELAPRLGLKDWNLRLLAFDDFARTKRVEPQPGEEINNGISSWGLGLRMNLQKSLALRLDVAQILNEGGTREEGHWRFNLSKRPAVGELQDALSEVLAGRRYVSPTLDVTEVTDPGPAGEAGGSLEDLTPRELEVLRLLAEGLTMKEVGAALGITPRTVAYHKYRMMNLLEACSTAERVQFAVRQGIV